MKLIKNKKGQATAFQNYTYALASMFGIAVLGYLVIEYAVIDKLLPVLTNTVQNSPIDAATQSTILSNYGTIVFFLRMMPFAIFLIIVIWLFITNIRKENENIY